MTRDEALAELSLPPTATPKQIQRRYHQLALKVHPDHGGNAQDFMILNLLYRAAQTQLVDADRGRRYVRRDVTRAGAALGAVLFDYFGIPEWANVFNKIAFEIEQIDYD